MRGFLRVDWLPPSFLPCEIRKAIARLPTRKSSGPDSFPGLLYEKLPVVIPYLTQLLSLIFRAGLFPRTLRRIYLVPLLKAGKDPQSPESRRPIFPLSSVVKIAESVIYHRLFTLVGPRLSGAQYAYRRGRGTEMHLASLLDFAQRALSQKHLCYPVSYDVAGAVVCVPHLQLMTGLSDMGVDGFTRRVIHNWLRLRTFQVRYRTLSSSHLSSKYRISRRLPPKGDLLPPGLIFG